MENQETQPQEEMWQQWEKEHKRGKVLVGILVVTTGSLFLARELGVEFPHWLFTWKILLIAIGLVHFIKHGFRRVGWLIPVAIGSIYLALDIYPGLAIKPLIWPILVIMAGLFIIFRPRKKPRRFYWDRLDRLHKYHRYKYGCDHSGYCDEKTGFNTEDSIDYVSIMSGMKKKILTKKFKSGDITVVFGGAQIDFSQADIEDTATLEITQVFGGTQLIIPANWEINTTEIACVIGSIEDKRQQQQAIAEDGKKKTLILRGTIILGGLELKNF